MNRALPVLILGLVLSACGGAGPSVTDAGSGDADASVAGAPSSSDDGGRWWFEVLAVSQDAPSLGQLEMAATAEDVDAGWTTYGLPGAVPALDLDTTVVLFAARAEDNCPDDLVEVRPVGEVVETIWLPPAGGCEEPLVPTGYAVLLHRGDLGTTGTIIMRQDQAYDGDATVTYDLPPYDGPPAPGAPDVPIQPGDDDVAALFDGHPVRPCTEFPSPLDEAALVDGPLSDDPDVAAAQQARADQGLASDAATVQARLADPTNLEQGFDFPLTPAEFGEIFARQDIAVQAELGPYLQAQPTYAWSYYEARTGGMVVAFATDPDGLDEQRRALADRFPDVPIEVVAGTSTEQERQAIVTGLFSGQDDTDLPLQSGSAGFDRAEVGLLDPTRADLDTLAALVDVSLVCVSPVFNGVSTGQGDAAMTDVLTDEPTEDRRPLLDPAAPAPATDVDLASPRPVPNDPDVVVRSGAAGRMVACDGAPTLGGWTRDFGGPGQGAADPEAALATFVDQGLFDLPRSGYRTAATNEGRVLFTHDVDGRARVAVIVADHAVAADELTVESGWSVEVFATCDASEHQPAADAGRAAEVWTTPDGERVPADQISSRLGPEHCGWESVTFLTIGLQTYLRDPGGVLRSETDGAYRSDVAGLPDDAVDTGYRREPEGGVWIAADGASAYVGGPRGLEQWPHVIGSIGCA